MTDSSDPEERRVSDPTEHNPEPLGMPAIS
jgi:hypothetical protein